MTYAEPSPAQPGLGRGGGWAGVDAGFQDLPAPEAFKQNLQDCPQSAANLSASPTGLK